MFQNSTPKDAHLRRLIQRTQNLTHKFDKILYYQVLINLNFLVENQANKYTTIIQGKLMKNGGESITFHLP